MTAWTTQPLALADLPAPVRAEADAVLHAFDNEAGITPTLSEVATIIYALQLIRAHPKAMTHGVAHRRLRDAIREIFEVVPTLLDAAEADAEAALAEARANDSSHFAAALHGLLAAAAPFRSIAIDESAQGRQARRRNKDGWWHRWALTVLLEAQLVLKRHGKPAGSSNATAPAVRVAVALLGLAGIQPTPEAIVAARRATVKEK